MQKQYRQSYFNLTRNNPLPSKCLPFSSRTKHSESLVKLLEINQTIMNLVDQGTSSLFHRKRSSHSHFLNADKKKTPPKRIHRNVDLLSSTINHSHSKIKAKSFRQKSQQIELNSKSMSKKKRKDLYDDHIERFMHSKYNKQEIIEQYLQNRQSFVKKACKEIKDDIKLDKSLKKSTEKLKDKTSTKKLPKIQEFISNKFKRSQYRMKSGEYLKSITHLKKAQTLELKNRQRKQRVFRRKIHSLEHRLDKIRDDNYH